MKKIIIHLLFIAAVQFCVAGLFAQSVAINTDGTAADASAILDVKSIAKGLLAPRMTNVKRTSIAPRCRVIGKRNAGITKNIETQ